MALPLYALTLFVSAFILFLVQPIIGKIILPKLGGTPQVWNTCMVFFQMVLLGGYAYTHNVSTRLNLRQQLIAHAALLFLPLLVLVPVPFALSLVNPHYSIWDFAPDLGTNPIPSTLRILFTYVALPFIVVATTAPLLQKWFAYTGHPAAKDPYFLYGASNFGSMLSLIVYPTLIEPYVSLQHQGWIYTAGYVALMVGVLACAAMVWGTKEAAVRPVSAPNPEPALAAPQPTPGEVQTGITATAPAPAALSTGMKAGQPKMQPRGAGARPAEPVLSLPSDDLTNGRRFRWVMLAAVPSSLMLGITTHITTDLSPQPMFWLIPLILYLASFILVFARWPVVWTEAPHTFFLYAQPFCVAGMIIADVLHLASSPGVIGLAIFLHVLGFFATTMVCHGELAKDRPSTKYLTEFYLWMSVGGMVGGMFNALIAPVIFSRVWEFPLAIFAAALVRPRMFDTGLLDNWIASLFEGQAEQAPVHKPGHKGGRPTISHGGAVVANESLVRTLDIVWPLAILALTFGLGMWFDKPNATAADKMIAYGVPLALCCFCMSRPLRIGLGVGAVLGLHLFVEAQQDRSSRFISRSYFGAISVKEYGSERKVGDNLVGFSYRQLIHGHIDHGMNFLPPANKKDGLGDPLKDLSRLATTYYHREGPVGRVMEKFNWFPGPPNSNTYWADARLPASLAASIFADLGTGTLPMTTFVTAWSEPPIATVGLGTGTMASYGRPYQHVHFYEIDNQILRLSLYRPSREITSAAEYKKFRADSSRIVWFNYLEQAIDRGCTVQVLMGDARLRMAMPYKNHYETYLNGQPDVGGGPEKFYHMMVIDAFSSDAIPAHLLTKESFKLYFEKLSEEGILCVHTSNRFVALPKVVAAVSANLGYSFLRGHDVDDDRNDGHYTSEWVMVARKADYLKHLTGDTTFLERYEANLAAKRKRSSKYWDTPRVDPRFVWTDDYYNLLSVVRWGRGGDDD